ncbi:hypothetical protein SLEP1_g25859 [Rubroshorea leprosula]|uniref:Secreted protein n=1 Tax=Rubroshorea leprosula TaxID=152421 RepID=A0AAV5JNA9_9ROSI|nr:hypothetical protein SLEP1_g25859 [Rubroshorea leprosula]
MMVKQLKKGTLTMMLMLLILRLLLMVKGNRKRSVGEKASRGAKKSPCSDYSGKQIKKQDKQGKVPSKRKYRRIFLWVANTL